MEINGYCSILKNCMETEFNFQIISTWWKIFFFFKFFTHPFKNLEIIIDLWVLQNQATGHIWLKGFSMSSKDCSGERPRWGARQTADAFSSQRCAMLGTSLVVQLIKTPHVHCRGGLGLIPAQETKIPKCDVVKMLRGKKRCEIHFLAAEKSKHLAHINRCTYFVSNVKY